SFLSVSQCHFLFGAAGPSPSARMTGAYPAMQALCLTAANSPGGCDPIMRFIIYGAGGIGSGIGGHLWRTGHEAILIGRSGHVGKIHAAGLRLITGTDEYRLDVPAVTHPREIEFRADDVVLLTMKSHDSAAAL